MPGQSGFQVSTCPFGPGAGAGAAVTRQTIARKPLAAMAPPVADTPPAAQPYGRLSKEQGAQVCMLDADFQSRHRCCGPFKEAENVDEPSNGR
jgi:hypothetical protein